MESDKQNICTCGGLFYSKTRICKTCGTYNRKSRMPEIKYKNELCNINHKLSDLEMQGCAKLFRLSDTIPEIEDRLDIPENGKLIAVLYNLKN